MRPTRIKPDHRVAFRLAPRERDLIIEHTSIDAELEERLQAAQALGSRLVVHLTPELNAGGFIDREPRVGAAAHVATDEQYLTMRDAGAFGDDVVSGAADAILLERAPVLLIGRAAPGVSV